MTRLIELDASFRKINGAGHHRVEALSEADGVMFLCPKCFATNGGEKGTHMKICWAPHVPQEHSPTGGRWPMTGTSLDDLTLVPSVAVHGECAAHFCVRNGLIEMAG